MSRVLLALAVLAPLVTAPPPAAVSRETKFVDSEGREIALEDLPSELEVRVRPRERGGKMYAEVVTVMNAPPESDP